MRRRSGEDYREDNPPAVAEMRLYRMDGAPASDAEYRAAFREVMERGHVPNGWEVRGAQWANVRATGKDSARFTRWAQGSVFDVQAFASVTAAAADVDIGVHRVKRTMEVEEVVRETVREWVNELLGSERPHAKVATAKYRKGDYVSAAWARRYPDKVVFEQRTVRRLQERVVTRKVRRMVTVEEAVVRVTYKRVAALPEPNDDNGEG